jgi:hypothetical protein
MLYITHCWVNHIHQVRSYRGSYMFLKVGYLLIWSFTELTAELSMVIDHTEVVHVLEPVGYYIHFSQKTHARLFNTAWKVPFTWPLYYRFQTYTHKSIRSFNLINFSIKAISIMYLSKQTLISSLKVRRICEILCHVKR